MAFYPGTHENIQDRQIHRQSLCMHEDIVKLYGASLEGNKNCKAGSTREAETSPFLQVQCHHDLLN